MIAPVADHDALVHAWADELRTGSTRTWAQFRAEPAPGVAGRGRAPGAANLELLRRLGGRDLPDRGRLGDLVLTTAPPGRGLVDVPLVGGEAGSFGPSPVEPEALPAAEVLRVACGVLVHLLTRDVPAPLEDREPRQRWRRRHVLTAGPVEDLMAQRWARRVRSGSGVRWQRMWRVARTRDQLPPALRLDEVANRLSDRYGARRVTVRVARPPSVTTGVDGVLATDLLRRLNPLLVLAVGEAGRTAVVAQRWPAVLDGLTTGHPLGAPRDSLDWAVTVSARVADELVEGGRAGRYAVHGDPGLLVPDARRDVRRRVRPEDVLALALDVVARTWTEGTH